MIDLSIHFEQKIFCCVNLILQVEVYAVVPGMRGGRLACSLQSWILCNLATYENVTACKRLATWVLSGRSIPSVTFMPQPEEMRPC
jgi:hypothetical protein